MNGLKKTAKWINKNKGKFISLLGSAIIINSSHTILGGGLVILGFGIDSSKKHRRKRKMSKYTTICTNNRKDL